MNRTRLLIRKAIVESLDKHPHFSNRRIAEEISSKVGRVSHVTVGKHRQKLGRMTGFITGKDKISRARPLTPGLRKDLRDALSNLRQQFLRVQHLQPALHEFHHDQLWPGKSMNRLDSRRKEFEELRDLAYAGVQEINESILSILPRSEVTS